MGIMGIRGNALKGALSITSAVQGDFGQLPASLLNKDAPIGCRPACRIYMKQATPWGFLLPKSGKRVIGRSCSNKSSLGSQIRGLRDWHFL